MYKEIIEKTNTVYEHLQDDISKDIYKARVMNSMTFDYNYITQIAVDGIDVIEYLSKQLLPYISNGIKLVLDGAGYYGQSIKRTLNNIEFICFCDKNPRKNFLMGIPVLSRKEAVERYPNAVFIITSMVYDLQIKNELELLGAKNILDFGKYLNEHSAIRENQYYDTLQFGCEEVIADVGCYDCFTTKQYFKLVTDKYKKIYSFEPEPEQFIKCRNLIAEGNYKNWEIYNCGICDETGKLFFSANKSCTKISADGDIEVKVIRLDDFFKTHEVPTFIKMDIEGAEMSALRGCAETIKKYKPKLAICVYHKPEDIFEIPEYILSLNPDYKLWLRHYTNLVNETVLYCE